jgi:hypothetical protein
LVAVGQRAGAAASVHAPPPTGSGDGWVSAAMINR